jgi:hypothetical protein
MIALGGTGYAALALPNNSVKSKTIKNGQVKKQDLASGAVTSAKIANGAVKSSGIGNGTVTFLKLAPGSVRGPQIADDRVTGAKVDETTLRGFGCEPTDFQVAKFGFCVFRVDPGSARTWAQTVGICTARNADSVLPTMAQLQAVSTAAGSPLTNVTVWSAGPAGTGSPPSAWVLQVTSGQVTNATAVPINDSTMVTTVACVYEPASKGG